MMKSFDKIGLAFGLALATAAAAQADPFFIEGRLNLRAQAQVYPDNLQWLVDNQFRTGAYGDLGASASAVSNTSYGVAMAFSAASASWDSTASGTVSFQDTGFIRAISSYSGSADFGDSAWSYTFYNDDGDTFALDYAITVSQSASDTTGLQGFTLALVQDGELVFSCDMTLEDSDTVYAPLEPGQIYTAYIIPAGALQDATGLGISAMQADFRWEIQ